MFKYYNFSALVMHLTDNELLLFIYIIIDLKLTNGVVHIDELARKFKLSNTTIRNYLAKIGNLNMFHYEKNFDTKLNKKNRCRTHIHFIYPANILLDYVHKYVDLLVHISCIDENHIKNYTIITNALEVLKSSNNKDFLFIKEIELKIFKLQQCK